MQTLELAVKEPLVLRVEGRDYSVTFPLPSVIWLEHKLGRSMKLPTDWWKMTTAEVPDIIRAGLMAAHPDDTEAITARVVSALDAEGIEAAMDSLCVVAFPIATGKFKEEMETIRERIKRGLQPKNGESADAS